MTPSTLPNGSTTDAVTNDSLRWVIGSYSVAPSSISRATVASMSSTCQFAIAPPGDCEAPGGAKRRSMKPNSSWWSPIRNSM